MKITVEIHGLKITRGYAYDGEQVPQSALDGLQEMADILTKGVAERDNGKKINYFNRKVRE